jgi:hypothetical protein
MSEGEQEGEPTTVGRQAGEQGLLARAGTGGTGAGMAETAAGILETRREEDCVTREDTPGTVTRSHHTERPFDCRPGRGDSRQYVTRYDSRNLPGCDSERM